MKKILLVTLLFVVIILALREVKSASAESNRVLSTRYAHCQKVLMIIATPHIPKGANPHPGCVPVAQKGTDKRDLDESPVTNPPDTSIVIPPPVITDENPPIVTNPPDNDGDHDQHGNNGHGNNQDGCDSSNPSGKCPHGGSDDSVPIDDEKEHKNK